MLSNTDDKKPSPSAVCHEASGSCSTGIIDAESTSDSRNSEPFSASGSSDHSGRRTRSCYQQRHPHRGAKERKQIGDLR